MEFKISINEWLVLPANEKKYFQYVSDQSGCYFKIEKQVKNDSDVLVDDFERLKGE